MLTLPPKFKQALGNGTRTSLYPLVRIYKGYQIDDNIPDNAEAINLSIKETTIKNLDTENDTYESYMPLLLNSPSISSKADIINNKYTISSVSLSISNAPYNGKIFSDDIPNLLNAVVQVYYAANGLDSLDDCLLVYTGTIRRYSQSAETLNLTLEDLTEQKLKTQIPSTLIDDSDIFNDEQIGKPYPMVYGYVDKSPLVLDKFDNLIIDKPNMQLIGTWNKISNVQYLNPAIENTELFGTWLQKNAYLFTYKDGYMPIMEQFPFNFGSRLKDINEGTMYSFQPYTTNDSAKIILNANNFIFEKYTTQSGEEADETEEFNVGTGKIGIPTRIYRPVVNVQFYAKNHGYDYSYSTDQDANEVTYLTMVDSSNLFYGFFNNELVDNLGINIYNRNANRLPFDTEYSESNYQYYSNNYTIAVDLYNDSINAGDGNWWQPTDVNDSSYTFDSENEGIWSYKDLNYPEPYQSFNVDWIQNASNQSGIHMHSVNRHNSEGGCFIRLQLNQDVPEYPAITKIFYKIDYFVPQNIGDNWHNIESEPSKFWIDRNLILRDNHKCDEFDDLVSYLCDWEDYYDNIGGEWNTRCEVPSVDHSFEVDNTQRRYTNNNLGGMQFNNIILGFDSTNSTDSINWGSHLIKGDNRDISSCIANLKQFYTIQDVLITDYIKEEFYASIIGRTEEVTLSIDIITINAGPSYSIIYTDGPHRLDVGDTFELYDENNLLVGIFTCATVPLENSILTEENVNLQQYDNGRVQHNQDIEITKAQNVLQNILTEELAYSKQVILPDENIKDDWINSFTLQEQKEAKSVIESLFKSSIYIPSFDSAGNFKFIDLKQNIEDYEQFEVIDNLDIIKYSFGLTKLEDVKNQVNIKYKKDYGSDDFVEETTYGIEDNNGNFVETLDELTEQLNVQDMVYDISYYGMKKEDAKLEVESEYIRDKETARKLQRRLLMWYANQHLTMKLNLPPSYMHLEAGDYLRFDELIGGKLAFGFDYTQEFVKNGQLIYPVFFVTKVAKSLSGISLELVQVHRGDFGRNDADISNYLIPNPYNNTIYGPEFETEEDEEELYFQVDEPDVYDLQEDNINFIVNTNFETSVSYEIALTHSSHAFKFGDFEIEEGIPQFDFDATSILNDTIIETADPNGDNVRVAPNYLLQSRADIEYTEDSSEDIEDVDIILEYDITIKPTANSDFQETISFIQTIPPVYVTAGDVNRDGVVNVLDIVSLTNNYILGNYGYSEEGDLNNDGGNNIQDIVIMINLILG